MKEFGLLHETSPSRPIPRPESSLYDDHESSLPLESAIIDDASLPDLEEVVDPPFTSSPLVAPSPSSTPLVTSTSDSTLFDSPFPLAQCTGLEVGETSGGDVRTLADVSLSRSKEFKLVAPHLEEAPFVELYGDLVMGTDTRSTGTTDPIGNEHLDLTPASSLLPSTNPSHAHAFHESLGDISGYDPSFDPDCANLEDVPRKITQSPFFTNIFDFSVAFGVFTRPLTFIDSSFVVPSYLHHSEMHASTYDKLLRALIASASRTRLLSLDARSG